PNLPKGGTYRIFSIGGDSMLPIPNGSEVIGRFVGDWSHVKPDTPCVAILKGEQDFVFKLVTLQDNGKFVFKSLNKLYEPFEADAEDVLEIWSFQAYITAEFPSPEPEMNTILVA